MARAFPLGILAALWSAHALAAELPELDILELCKPVAREEAAKWSQSMQRPQEDFLESAYTICLHGEVEARRDARWRLRMLRDDDQEICVEQGIAAGTYTAIGSCLDKFTGPLRG